MIPKAELMQLIRSEQRNVGFRRVEVLLHEAVIEELERQAEDENLSRGEYLTSLLNNISLGAAVISKKEVERLNFVKLPWQEKKGVS